MLWKEIGGEHPGGDEAVVRLRDARSKAKADLARVLPDGAVDKLIQVSTGSHKDADLGCVPVKAAAPDLLGRSFRRAKRAADGLDKDSKAQEIHLLRRRAKRLRDELEFFLPLYRAEAKPVVGSLKKLQDLLGTHQDLVIVGEILAGFEGLPEPAVAAVRQVDGEMSNRRSGLRKQILKEAQTLGGDEWNRLEARMRRDRREMWR